MMKNIYKGIIILLLLSSYIFCQKGGSADYSVPRDSVSRLYNLLDSLSKQSDSRLFKLHCESIMMLINDRDAFTEAEKSFLDSLYITFSDTTVQYPGSKLITYTARHRPYIIAWRSPTDSKASHAWMLPPENYEEGKSYPLYIVLHGYWNPYANSYEYMTRCFFPENYIEKPFQDGFSIYPWGRGNLWYLGISQVDIWEAMDFTQKQVNIIPERRYITGHSMGGFGAWVIGQQSPETWAAVGVYAGALWYDNNNYLNIETALKLSNTPVYIVCGNQDQLLSINQQAYGYLESVYNENIQFQSFPGGHESLYENWDAMYLWIRQFSKSSNGVESSLLTGEPGFNLLNNYPNPFNSSTIINFSIPAFGHVDLRVYDVLGREVAVLADKDMNAGNYKIEFSPGNNLNRESASGVYFYCLRTGDNVITRKMILSK